jgi:methyl-accepting chemotaxis protein
MNFDEAIQAHASWKMKLSSYLRNPDGSLNPDEICKDNQCTLGKWLHGEGKAYAANTEYGMLKTAHANFHKEAADIVRRATGGQKVSDETVLGAKSKFSDYSAQIVTLLRNLRNKMKAAS